MDLHVPEWRADVPRPRRHGMGTRSAKRVGPAIDKTGFIYMLAGDTGASNTDPYAKAKTADNHWIQDRLARDDRRCRCQGDGGLHEDRPMPMSPTKPYMIGRDHRPEHLMIPVK